MANKESTFDFATERLPGAVQFQAPLLELGVVDLLEEGRTLDPVGRVPVLELGALVVETVGHEAGQVVARRPAARVVHQPFEFHQHHVGVEAQLLVDERFRVAKQLRHLHRVQQPSVAEDRTANRPKKQKKPRKSHFFFAEPSGPSGLGRFHVENR